MKKVQYILLFLVLGCSTPKVVYDYDIKTDFSKYKTYAYFDDVGDGMNQLDVKRFIKSLDSHLDSIGIKRTDKPDFFINVISDKRESPKNNNVGVGVGTGGRNGGISISTGLLFGGNKIEEKITIDFVASSNNKLFWQGELIIKVREKIKPQERVKIVGQVVKKILDKYPPN